MNDVFNSTIKPEEEVENMVDEITEEADLKCFNFSINASNQANLTNTSNLMPTQVNALFVLIYPYHLESFDLEDMNLAIKMSEDHKVSINRKEFETAEVEPGIRIFGITKSSGE